MSDSAEDQSRNSLLARITDNPQLARAVPRLQPDVLHAMVLHIGLQDCSELLALATPEQLSAVFDLDLWKAERAGEEEQFDVARFCEWLEVLVDAGPSIAADRLSTMDPALVVAGLAAAIKVFDLAVFSPDGELSGADAFLNAGRERGVHFEIGGYLIVARHPDAWEAIVQSLVALHEHQGEAFQRLMRGCRTLSSSDREIDIHDLLQDGEQASFDLSVSREERRERLGFLSPQQAHAFLDASRGVSFSVPPPDDDLVFAGYLRSLASDEPEAATGESDISTSDESPDDSAAVASVVDVLRGAGVIPDPGRPLLTAGHEEPAPAMTLLHEYLQATEADSQAWVARNQELAFLANALLAGCSVQGRAFSRREAMDAVTATCNLGLARYPAHWPAPSAQNLVAIFRVGWTVLHDEVSMAAATRVLEALAHVRSSDRDLQLGMRALRSELRKQRHAGTPWRARGLEVLASFDLSTWAALAALFDQCPVMLANVCPPGGRPVLRVDPAAFQFIASVEHVTAVQEFLGSIVDRLTR
jgi:hypothetical protein